MSGAIEITLGEHKLNIYSTSTAKINNVKRFFNAGEEVRSEETEIIPGKKIAFVVKPLQEKAPIGFNYTHYLFLGDNTYWTAITGNDKFLSLELVAVAGEDVDLPRLAGKVEIILGDTSQSFSFGDPLKGEYLQFDASLMPLPGVWL